MNTQKQRSLPEMPDILEKIQLAVDAAFASGVAYGKASAEAETAPAIRWTSVEERLPDPDLWLVTVDTEGGPLVYVLELNEERQWIHEGEPTFCHSYMFHPTHWAPVPAPAVINQEEI